MLCGLFCFVFSHLNRLQRQLQLNITIHEQFTRKRPIRENDHPGIVFLGKVFLEKKPSGKVTIRETTVFRRIYRVF